MTFYGYAQVSVREPEDKNLDLQVERLVRAGCALGNVRAEEASGAKNDRGGLLVEECCAFQGAAPTSGDESRLWSLIRVSGQLPLSVRTDSISCIAYVSATALTHDGFTQNSQIAARVVCATATASRITTTLSGLTKTSHHGSGQGRPHIVSNSNVKEGKARATAIAPPIGRRPHKLRLKP